MTTPLAVLMLAAPALLLAAAVVALCALGPLGWIAAAGLVAAVGWASRWAWRRCRAWWQGTRAPDLAPGERYRGQHFRDAGVSGGTGPAAEGTRARPGGTSRG